MDICNPIVRPIERIVLILMLRAIPPASSTSSLKIPDLCELLAAACAWFLLAREVD